MEGVDGQPVRFHSTSAASRARNVRSVYDDAAPVCYSEYHSQTEVSNSINVWNTKVIERQPQG